VPTSPLSPLEPGPRPRQRALCARDTLRIRTVVACDCASFGRCECPARRITAGANESGDIQWQLKQDDALQAEAAKKALNMARQIASQMAAGLGVKLGTLVYASNQTPAQIMVGAADETVTVTDKAAPKPNLKPLAISPEKIQKRDGLCCVCD